MDSLFHVLVSTCLALTFSEGFLIIHVQKQQCLSEKKGVIMEKCNMTSLNQKWQWTADDRLLQVKSAQCLSISTQSALSSRSIIVDCTQAVRWNCHEDGLLKVANSSLFLTKQGQKVMAKRSKKYLHTWMQLKASETGKPVYVNLCSKQDLQDADTSVWSTRTASFSSNAVTSRPENVLKSSTEIFIRNVTEHFSKNPIENLYFDLKSAVTEKAWIPTTTLQYSSTTEEETTLQSMYWGRQTCFSYYYMWKRIRLRNVFYVWEGCGQNLMVYGPQHCCSDTDEGKGLSQGWMHCTTFHN